jgi:alkylation response protein AidB-like acyl-CoA dehydrogenase
VQSSASPRQNPAGEVLMTTHLEDYRTLLQQVCTETIGPATAEVDAAAGEPADEVLGLAMRVCGGAAFRKEVGVERCFHDARAAGVMAPTTDVLYDFIGKAVCGMSLF